MKLNIKNINNRKIRFLMELNCNQKIPKLKITLSTKSLRSINSCSNFYKNNIKVNNSILKKKILTIHNYEYNVKELLKKNILKKGISLKNLSTNNKFPSFKNESSDDDIKSFNDISIHSKYKQKIIDNKKEKELLIKKIKLKNKNKIKHFYTNSILSKTKNSSNNSLTNYNNINEHYMNETKSMKFYPNIGYKMNKPRNFLFLRETLGNFNKSVREMRKNKFVRYSLNKKYNDILEQIENEKSKLDLIQYKIETNKKLLEKYMQILTKNLLNLKGKIEEENKILNNYKIYYKKLKSEINYIQYDVDRLKNKKMYFCRYKTLLLQIKFNVLELNEIDEKILLEYGMENCKRINLNQKIIYYDDTNDNNIGQYIPRKNPSIFKNLFEFEQFFINKELKIIKYCMKYIKTNNIIYLENELKTLKEKDKNDEKNIQEKILSDEKYLLNLKLHQKQLLSIKKVLIQKNKYILNVKIMINLENLISTIVNNKFILEYIYSHYEIKNNIFSKKKENENSNIIIDGLAFLEEVVNNIMKETNIYKKKNIKKYISVSNKYILNKNLMNNKKLIEESKIGKEKKMIDFLLKGYPYIFKPIRKIEDKLKFSKLKSQNLKKKNMNNDLQKEYIDELEKFIKFK